MASDPLDPPDGGEDDLDKPLSDGLNPAGWWEVMDGAWRWITNPTPG
jgi:hypothetical protein